jgi:hypothetical protein
LYVLSTVTAVRAIHLKFAEKLRFLLGCFVLFAVCSNLGGVPHSGWMCAWLILATVLPLARLWMRERKTRQAFAENEAARCGTAVRHGTALALMAGVFEITV